MYVEVEQHASATYQEIVNTNLATRLGFSICIPLIVRIERTRDTTQDAPTAKAISTSLGVDQKNTWQTHDYVH